MDKRDQDRLFGELDTLGEDEVRARRAAHTYNERKGPTVDEWLRRQERKREDAAAAREGLMKGEEIAVARSASEAAWASARWAKIAAGVAALALIVAGYAALTGSK
jgi:hypothetical protein